jgi:hypothetical protein
MMQDQFSFEMSLPMSAEEVVGYIGIAMSAGTGASGLGRIGPSRAGSGISRAVLSKPHSTRSLGSITKLQAERIQQIADRYEVNVDVIGSRARGNATADSDWDYVITGGNSKSRSNAFRDLPSGRSGGDLGPNSWTGKERIAPEKVYDDEPRVRFTPNK